MASSPVATAGPECDTARHSRDDDQRSWRAGEFTWVPDAHAAERRASTLSTVAHELRVPITALTASSELLLADLELLDLEQIRKMLLTFHRGALWLQNLVENLLCAATIRDGRFRLHPQPIWLMDVIEEVGRVVGPILTQKDQRLRTLARDEDAEVSADPRRIGQILVNLISNASKFSGRGTPIDVVLARRGEMLRVTVADRGPGIAPGDSEQLFEPYHRGVRTTRLDGQGVGLGLAIVRSVVEAHDGCLGVANRRSGGASFWFELPIRSPRYSSRRITLVQEG